MCAESLWRCGLYELVCRGVHSDFVSPWGRIVDVQEGRSSGRVAALSWLRFGILYVDICRELFMYPCDAHCPACLVAALLGAVFVHMSMSGVFAGVAAHRLVQDCGLPCPSA